MCVCKEVGGVREVGFRGKLPHHLFIQSTEDGVSWERGGGRPGNSGGQELFFLASSAILCLGKKRKSNK